MPEELAAMMVVRDVRPSSGGLAVSVPALADHLARRDGMAVTLTVSGKFEVDRNRTDALQCRFHVATPNCEAPFENHDIVHVNGLWDGFLHRAVAGALRHNRPLVVSTRGMLEPWALNHKALKKRAGWWLYQRRDLSRAAVLHATSEAELNSIREMRLTNPVCLTPNGVDSHGHFLQPGERTNTLLFLGRLHPIKGTRYLLDSGSPYMLWSGTMRFL